jgi:hypothetical protein
MSTLIIFNDDTKNARNRLIVKEEPAQVAAALEKSPIPNLTTPEGEPIWVNAAGIRVLKAREGKTPSARRGGAGRERAGRPRRKGKAGARRGEAGDDVG